MIPYLPAVAAILISILRGAAVMMGKRGVRLTAQYNQPIRALSKYECILSSQSEQL